MSQSSALLLSHAGSGRHLQASLLSGQNGRINVKKKAFHSAVMNIFTFSPFFFLFFKKNTSHFDSAAPSAERPSSLLSLLSSIRLRLGGARRSFDTDHPSSGCCGHRRWAEPSPEGCAHGWEGEKGVCVCEGWGVLLHEVAGTISQQWRSGSPACQDDESCALIRKRRLCRRARSFKEKKKRGGR